MKRLSITQLIPGMIVAEDVYDMEHELLASKGTVLTDRLITKLDLYGILSLHDALPIYHFCRGHGSGCAIIR